ncbi:MULTISPECIES: DUF6542 domain-containing protein [Prauserella salsuginis group]|uniref:DUF6542 domain-containing protein n=2 Tax=Prauserella salsuginis group TaxID=2893672 RepID=A0A839XKJ2_9PSEU|nr:MULTISPECIES: DUF6542 domain-containing protein [Prauserella salsuginis group]MBB3663800.1 hypothetical protein [Prauserella sediminis]
MTATRDRRSDPDAANEDEPVPWDERLAFGARRGLPWWGAVLLALVTAIAGAVLSMQVSDGLGLPFQLIYVAGVLAAVAGVRRRNLFGPMVQPPLVMAATVPLVVLTDTSLPESNDTLADVLAISTPLINNFPVMAIATALTVGLGVLRIYRERDPDRPLKDTSKRSRADDTGDSGPAPKEKRPAKSKTPGPADATAAAEAAGVAGGRGPADDAGTSGRRRTPRPPEDRPDAQDGRGEPPRRPRPADGGRGPRGPEDAPPPRRPRSAEPDRGPRTPPPDRRPARPPRTPPDAAERKRRIDEWPDAIPGPKRPQRPPRGERPEPPQRPKRPRGSEPPRGDRPGRDQPRRRPWDAED